MATNTVVLAGVDTFIVDSALLATDATSGNIAHGLGAVPLEIHRTVLSTGTVNPLDEGMTVDATNLVLTKQNLANTARTYRVTLKRPHTTGR